MKRHGLLVVALLLPLTGLPLYRAGWSLSPAGQPARSRLEVPRTHDERLSEAVWRWRDGQPHHWRDCLMQR